MDKEWIDGTAVGRVYGITMQCETTGETYEVATTVSCPDCGRRTYETPSGRACEFCGGINQSEDNQ